MRISEQMRETMISLRNFRAASNAQNPLPARSAPFRKIGSSGYARILSKIGALRHARYARSDHGQIGALRALNLANGALRASQLSLTEICVKCFFSSVGSCPSRLLEWCLPSPTQAPSLPWR